MSVFTPINTKQLEDFLKDYSIGAPTSFKGIEAGITNSNFFVDTDLGRYVLTIVEHEHPDDVEWFMKLLAYLHSNNIPCAQPVESKSNTYTKPLDGKPATLVERLVGFDKVTVTPQDCHAIGQVIARFHVSCSNYALPRQDSRGETWRIHTAKKVRPQLNETEQQLLDTQMQPGNASSLRALPTSVIHADLFRDNVLFHEDDQLTGSERISGIIDFYYACNGCMLYDLAIAFNDWCRDDNTHIEPPKAQALLAGYESIRPLLPEERDAWPNAIKTAALRFWLSRLHDLHFPPEALMTYTKDPTPYQKILAEAAIHYVDIAT